MMLAGFNAVSEQHKLPQRCQPDEAFVSPQGRNTCYPAQFLPPELMFYLDKKE